MSREPSLSCSCGTATNEDAHRDTHLDLFIEFLNCVMEQNFSQALLLCRQILEVEPENQDVKDFFPLLTEAEHMKSTGYFHTSNTSSADDSDSDTADEQDSSKTSSSSESSDCFEYSTSDSESYGGRSKNRS
ncbi:hypothetical protein P879_11726 [Paragonimus westermani]|uniref:Glutamate-rich protein 2 n=1 Tax=Paragonimus westermani TaxID=34504 RepID=A0A8T0D8M3_9TREM|nr:hypothetical protein P879_11726 [Paragonimus westermani]